MAKLENRNLKASAVIVGLGLFSCTLVSELLFNNYCIGSRSLFYSAILGVVTAFAWYFIMKYSIPVSK